MARLNAFIKRENDYYNAYLGRVLLFCEGFTEVNYFSHFADIIEKNKSKYSRIEIVPVNAEGNAQRVLNCAIEFLDDDEHIRKYGLYEKYLIFDCDAPDEIQQVINDMEQSAPKCIITPTNLLFETWLLMHFEEVDSPLSKGATYQRMADALGIKKYSTRQKNSQGMIRKIIGNGDSVRLAIDNAKQLENVYNEKNLKILHNITEMNPYTAVHMLMENILSEMENASPQRK